MRIKRIGLLTSGGDSPGMNAAIRSVVRCALFNGLEVTGILRGYEGAIEGELCPLNHRSVSNIINRGGTILKTARSQRFFTHEGQAKAVDTLKKNAIDALVVIGGDGSYRGADVLFREWGVATIGLPGTIDNDLCGTGQTIGCQTAVTTALEAIDKIRDTAHSLERIFIVEVMGRQSGYIALEVALGSGAEDVIIPERPYDYESMYKDILEGNRKGKVSWIIVVAEGAGKAHEIAAKITQVTKLESRFVVLGHIQRGGSPAGPDRTLATRLGVAAVESLLAGRYGKAVGVVQNNIHLTDLAQACQREKLKVEEYYRLMKILR